MYHLILQRIYGDDSCEQKRKCMACCSANFLSHLVHAQKCSFLSIFVSCVDNATILFFGSCTKWKVYQSYKTKIHLSTTLPWRWVNKLPNRTFLIDQIHHWIRIVWQYLSGLLHRSTSTSERRIWGGLPQKETMVQESSMTTISIKIYVSTAMNTNYISKKNWYSIFFQSSRHPLLHLCTCSLFLAWFLWAFGFFSFSLFFGPKCVRCLCDPHTYWLLVRI